MSATSESPETIRRVHDAAASGVVRVGRHGGRGCGVVVAEGVVVTNAHNLRDRTTEIGFADGRSVQARALGVDPDGDLAVLEVDTGHAPALAWSDREPALGEAVYSVARTGDGTRVTSGRVSGVDRSFRGPRGRRITGGIEHTAALAKGSSGSPLLDEDGNVLGITTLRLGDGFSIAVPGVAELRARIDDLRAGKAPQRRLLGIGVAPAHVTLRLRRAVGLPDRDGVLVRGVEPGSPAAAAGLQRGDLLTKVGDHEVTDADDVVTALDAQGDADTITLHVLRGTDELDLTATFTSADEMPTDAPPADAPVADAEPDADTPTDTTDA
jgi:S1-C subfamily serine protease